jgi:chitodextrinase
VAVQGYKIYRNGTYLSSVGPIGSTSFSDTGLANATKYTYTVSAVDAGGNESAPSTPSSATTGPDLVAPSAPTGLTAVGVSSTRTNLAWTASSDNVGVTGYRVYRSGALLFAVDGATTSATDWNVVPSTSYSYSVSAVDAVGNESLQSTSAIGTTGAGTGTILAADGFGRVVSGGWGSADNGGAWSGSTSAFGISSSTATISVASATNLNAYLASVAAGDQEGLFRVNFNKFAIGSNSEAWLYLRRQDTSNYYSARVIFTPAKQIQLNFSKTAAGTTTTVGSATSTLTQTTTDWYWMRVQLSGTTSVNGKLRVWKVGTAEPTTWLVNATDSAPPSVLRGTGHVGLRAQVAGTGPFPVIASYAALELGSIGSVASPDITAPSLPTGLAATVRSSARIDIAWNASTDNVGVQGYRVYRGSTLVATVASPRYSDTGLTASTQYSYRVASVDAAGNASAQTGSVSATTQGVDSTKPTIPTSLSATATAWNVVSLSWTASTDNVAVTRYTVLRGGISISVVDGSVTSFVDHGTSGKTQYSYTVKASDAAGNTSSASTAKSVTTPALDTTPPSIPTGLTATVASSSEVDLSWTASTDDVGVRGYKVYRNGSYVSTIGPVGSTRLSDTGLVSGTPYAYTVSAIDAAGNESAQTPVVSATPGPDLVYPSIPTGLSAAATAWNTVNLSWAASTDNIGVTRYTIYRGGTVLSVVTGTTSFTDRTTGPTTAYSYTVTASDAAGNMSSQSAATLVTTPIEVAVLSPESGVSVFGNESLSVYVSSGSPQVTYRIDGVVVGSSSVAPYTVAWDSTSLVDGAHLITAAAQDGANPTISSSSVMFKVANALDPATKVATDYGRGLIGTDAYALNEAYGLVAPTALTGRYSGSDSPDGLGLAEGLIGALPGATPATQDLVNAILSQPLRGTMYAPVAGATYGQINPNYPECDTQTVGNGGTTNYCQHLTAHFRIYYVLGGGPKPGPDDVKPDDFQNADLTASGCSASDHCNGVPDYIDHIAKALEEAWRTYVVVLGYDQPTGANSLLDVSIHQLAPGVGGQVVPPVWTIEISNSDGYPMYLARHEFFHRVQASYMPNLLQLALANRCPSLPPDNFVNCIPQWRWWLEATADWAAGVAESDSTYDDPNPSPPQAARMLGEFFQRPGADLENQTVANALYGKFILADYMSRTLPAGRAAIRQTWESIRAQGFGGSAKTAIGDVASANGSSLAALLDGFARSNWEQDYTPSWSSFLTDPTTVADDLGPARPARERREFVAGQTLAGSVLIGQGGTHYVELVPPTGGLGLFNVSVTGIYGAGVDVQLITYSNYSLPALPTRCSTSTATLTDSDTHVLSAQVSLGCRYVALIFTENAFSGDSFREFGWSATYSPAMIHDTFNRPDSPDGTGWGTADSGQTWIGNDLVGGQTGADVPFTLGGIAGGQGFIDIPGASSTGMPAASMRLPSFASHDSLLLGHFGDVTGPHSNPGMTHFEMDVSSYACGMNLDGMFSSGNPSPTGYVYVDTTQPFFLRTHEDETTGVIAYKVWAASSPEPQAWTLWWVMYGPFSLAAPLTVRTDSSGDSADFARFYIDEIAVWATSP